ncbi:CDP-alcohol phosphatidyltransferase family protein [Thioclava sp. BHET1]|uniref:Membrane protein n=1 Tax=Thioclava dalianensis TaxID=1185766 RepID=A0A074THY5_9RHOB|nr:CDP-alcohol phosphatidyltransferase family protein [Thioclava dalianensis]KEP69750.1 membrane protein [Thioclava dalianensis]TMV94579.1 CDP-alcohol phosphatidyltransferase family protein [Thioclava sp. BHET1]SFM94168.1 Phosphatidylglycerophosphate synthase [Thioclava dalianensis]
MIDATLQPLQRAILRSPASLLAARGVQADHVTLVGFGVGLLAIPALALQLYWVALVLILLNRLADGLDGAIARINGPTDRGAFLDIALDFLFYALIPVGFALADPAANALAASVLIAAFVGTGSSFLAFASIAAKRQISTEAYPTKGIYYLGGLTEGAETIVFFVAISLFPGLFAPLAYLFAAACGLTTVTRWLMGWRAFSDME